MVTLSGFSWPRNSIQKWPGNYKLYAFLVWIVISNFFNTVPVMKPWWFMSEFIHNFSFLFVSSQNILDEKLFGIFSILGG